jgi:hypothetical protein
MLSRLRHISAAEGASCGAEALDKILAISGGDMRKAVTTLQSVHNFYGDEVRAASGWRRSPAVCGGGARREIAVCSAAVVVVAAMVAPRHVRSAASHLGSALIIVCAMKNSFRLVQRRRHSRRVLEFRTRAPARAWGCAACGLWGRGLAATLSATSHARRDDRPTRPRSSRSPAACPTTRSRRSGRRSGPTRQDTPPAIAAPRPPCNHE